MYALNAAAALFGDGRGVLTTVAILIAVVVLREIFIAIFSNTEDRRR